jgi:hypothetical protein
MPNTNGPKGFTPKYLRGTAPVTNVFAPIGYTIASGYGTSLFFGDPVKLSGTSLLGRPDIVIQSTAGVVRGIFGGCEYTNAQGERIFSRYWPASTVATNIIAYVYDDPQTIFSIQADGAFAVTDVGQKVDYASGTGNTSTGNSGYVLTSSNIGTGDALLILGLDPTEGNEQGSLADVLVLLREHELVGTYTAV